MHFFNLISSISNFQKVEINHSSLPKVALSSILLTLFSFECIEQARARHFCPLILNKINHLKITLFAASFFASATFFGLFTLSDSKRKAIEPPAPTPFPRLKNDKNDCFINATIQMIFSNPDLTELLLENRNSNDSEKVLYFLKLQKLCTTYREAARTSSLTNLGPSFRKLHRTFNDSRMHDVCEFLTLIFINPLEQNDHFPFFKTTTYTPTEYGKSKKETGEVQAICHLPIPKKEELSGPLTTEELFSKIYENKITDSKCFKKEVTTLDLPDAFFISLMRFNNELEKLDTPLSFKPTFSIPASMSTEGIRSEYRWTSFIVHEGRSMDNGHYVSYSNTGNGYYRCDDTSIKKVSETAFVEAGKDLYLGVAKKLSAEETEGRNSPIETTIATPPLTQEKIETLSNESNTESPRPLSIQSSSSCSNLSIDTSITPPPLSEEKIETLSNTSNTKSLPPPSKRLWKSCSDLRAINTAIAASLFAREKIETLSNESNTEIPRPLSNRLSKSWPHLFSNSTD